MKYVLHTYLRMIGTCLQRASRGGILQPNDGVTPIENAFVFALDQNVLFTTASSLSLIKAQPLTSVPPSPCTAVHHLDHAKIGHAKIGR